MSRSNTLILVALLIALSGAHVATAQTSGVVHLAVQAGNGQVSTPYFRATLELFQPISVKATDVNGNPVAGATVTWVSTGGPIALANADGNGVATSVTGGNGIATENITSTVFGSVATFGQAFDVSTIQATSNGNSVVFTENLSLINQSSPVPEIQANSPTFGGTDLSLVNLSAPTGATLSTPILVEVAGLDTAANGVANVSVRLVNAQSSPIVTCASTGGYADPGSVLSNGQGLATCYPVFSGSGTGQFYVEVGGMPSNDISTALYLQEFPSYTGPTSTGYSFTSIPGTPTSVQIVSGNNQVGAVGVQLNALVAKLVDSNGNGVQNQTMTWTVSPAGAAALNDTTVTDNNGEVTAQLSLVPLAQAGASITVALKSNPSIAATFQETLQNALTVMNKISGDGQSAQQGTTFAQPIVVQILSATGPVANYPVQFQVTGPISILGSSTAGTNANGQASITVQAGGLSGTATVTAIAGALSKSFTLTVTAISTAPPPSSLVIVLGNSQSVIEGAGFTPLTVQVNNSLGPLSGIVVGFTGTGPVSLSSAAATTNGSGQATITATALNFAGPVTVTASITGFSQVFNLTVTPPGPSISATSFLNAASRQPGFISPCSLAILTASGLTPNGISNLSPAPVFARLPKSVNGLSVTFGGIAAPILNVAMGATNPEVTLQVPCEVTPGNAVPVVVNVNGGGTATVNIPVLTVSPGIFTAAMSDGVTRAVVVRQDGSFADIGGATIYDPKNPVRQNENVIFYMTGLGVTTPSVGTDSIENPLAYLDLVDAVVAGTVQAGIVGGSGLQVVSARQAPNLIGVYEVQVAIPATAPIGNNIPISIGIVPAGSSSSTPGVFGTANPVIPIDIGH